MKNKVLMATTIGLLIAISALTTIYKQQAFAGTVTGTVTVSGGSGTGGSSGTAGSGGTNGGAGINGETGVTKNCQPPQSCQTLTNEIAQLSELPISQLSGLHSAITQLAKNPGP